MLFFDTLRKGRSRRPVLRFFPELWSPSAGEQPALFTLSQSAIMWCDCAELQPTTKATTASSFVTSIFAWVVPFTLLNSVTASSCECKKKAVVQFWAVKGLLLRPVCQRPIKANCTGQAVHATIEGFSQNAYWQYIEFSVRKDAVVKWRGDIGFCFGRVVYEVFKGVLSGGRHPDGEKERLLEKERLGGEEKGGYRCLRTSLNMEPLCTNFLLSFWKVGSRSEAISRVLSPCWCELCRLW